jgi:hypothetical protein
MKPDLKWVDDALNGDENCPECDGELEDKWSASQNVSWLECECGFKCVYEQG